MSQQSTVNSQQIAIKVDNVSKTFKLPHEKHTSIKGLFVNVLHGNKTYEKQKVLKDISFEVKKGEFFGIVGRNGSGKSTLLKLMAGIYNPDEGHIQVNGKLTPFIELGVGFNPELTGRENVYLNGALLGFNRKEMSDMYEEIVEFAELEKFMDQKLKNYSSGMQVRLAFSIAIRAQSDLLLFDEVLAVGDAAFQQKCYETFDRMRDEGRTIVLVTHDMSAVQRFCQRAILIDRGHITLAGSPSDVANKYLEQNLNEQSADENSGLAANPEILVKNITLKSKGKEKKSFSIHEAIEVNLDMINKSNHQAVHLGLQIFNGQGAYCFGTNTKISGHKQITTNNANIKVRINQSFTPGTYIITLAVMSSSGMAVYAYFPKAAKFSIKQETDYQGIALMEHEWSTN